MGCSGSRDFGGGSEEGLGREDEIAAPAGALGTDANRPQCCQSIQVQTGGARTNGSQGSHASKEKRCAAGVSDAWTSMFERVMARV